MLVLLAVIMLNLLSPLVALIAVPIAAALIGWFGLATSKFIVTGISGIAPVAGMCVFAILYLDGRARSAFWTQSRRYCRCIRN